LLYSLLKIPAKFALQIYCRKLVISNKKLLEHNGPLLIAANHPNSFLDAIILATLFKKPVYSLVRGDVYKNNFYASLLNALNMMPVYRISEGAENLGHNYGTFDRCREIFKRNGIVLIFSEGRCINEWKLRPLKKGTARLAISSWEEGINLQVLPTGINYQSFTSFGKNIQLNFGNIINKEDFNTTNGYGNTINEFNKKLESELSNLVLTFDKNDRQAIKKQFDVPVSSVKKALLFFPAIVGYLLHFPLYWPVQRFSWRKASHNDHYDSVMVGLLFVLYPFYLLLITLLLWQWTCYYSLATFVILPFTAWTYIQLKKQY
jgi:1-acyl-sn-glycerol-3-phosphate acyltransferase